MSRRTRKKRAAAPQERRGIHFDHQSNAVREHNAVRLLRLDSPARAR